MSQAGQESPTQRVRGFYQGYAQRYDRETDHYDGFLLGDGRAKLCAQARGVVLEVAVGTGRNLPLYPRDVRLIGIDITPAMVDIARQRARDLRLPLCLAEADAQALPFADATFDVVVCTLALNAIPDDRAAIAEMYRALRPGGTLLLLGHVASHLRLVRAVQRLLERKSLPIAGDHQTRQPVPILIDTGFTIRHQHRSRLGVIHSITAMKPAV